MFKNKSVLVTPVNTDQTIINNKTESKPDYVFDLRMLVEENVVKITTALIAYKAATTILRAAEHVVVTKVK